MPSLLKEILEEFYEKIREFSPGTPRNIRFTTLANKINVAIGMRRTGKTYLLLQKIYHLIQENPDILTRILYLNLEDERLLPMDAKKLGQLIDDFYTLYPENHQQLCYLIFDEIQNVEHWEQVIRRFFDTKKVEIYLTGSSAKLLSKEIATSLRGRSIATEVWPFSFKEYLLTKKIAMPKILGKISQDNLLRELSFYLKEGGFPETVQSDPLDRVRVLQDYVNVVIFRDIIERHKITNVTLIKYLIKTLIKQSGSPFSVNKFTNDIKSQGMNVSKMTVHAYMHHMEDAYLIFSVPLYSESIRKIQTNPKKIYAIDTGLVHAYITSTSENAGHLFENLIYIELRRRGFDVYYYLTTDRREVDFLVKDIMGKISLYQVCWDISNTDTLERETRALRQAEKELNIHGEIITPHSFLEWVVA